jgi:PadR family transcriptional regulator PadR
MDNFKQNLKKGVLELSILKLLNDKDHYGYSLISEIKELSHDVIELKDGTLYPILYRLEDQKMIENYWETSSEGRNKPRKYYRITSKGKLDLEQKLSDYKEITLGVKDILGI